MPKRFLIALLLLAAPLAVPSAAVAATTPFPAVIPLVLSGQGVQGFATTAQTAHGYTASAIQTAYDVSPLLNAGLDGSGETIAFLEWGGFSQSDITAFDQANQLPDPTINETYVGGQQFPLDTSSTARGETTLDLEWAHAMAPAATLNVYYLNSNVSWAAGWREMAQAVTAAVNDGAGTISASFGICSPGTASKPVQSALAAAMQQGVGVFVSSGDSGAYAGPKKQCGSTPSVTYPASDPSVVAVGGTSLQLNSDNSIAAETAWNLSGGGKALPFLRPIWQVAPQLHRGKYRQAPDVSFLGDEHTGVQVYFAGHRIIAGGTSLGAPAWAGIWSLIEQDASQSGKTLGATPQIIYRIANSSTYSSAFHDIVSGGNTVYHAHVGWDRVTGWGTPDVNNLAAAVLAIS